LILRDSMNFGSRFLIGSCVILLTLGTYYTPFFGVVNVLQDVMKNAIEKVKSRAKKLFGLTIWILVILLLVSTIKNLRKVSDINSAVQREKDKVEKMKQENAGLEAQIAQTQGDAYIEKQIRDKLGLVKPGEAIVVLPDPEILRKLAPQIPEDQDALPDPNWKKWIKLFTP